MKKILYHLLVFALFLNVTHAQQKINLFGGLDFGPYKVGVKQLAFTDDIGTEPKEISIRLWYPGNGDGKSLQFADYLDYRNSLSRTEVLRDISTGIGGAADLFPVDSLELVLTSEMKAIVEAEATPGKFPLLLWSIRYGTVEYQNILSEYLASHGYLVAFGEDLPNAPYPWQFKSDTEKSTALQEQLAVLRASMQYLKQLPNIDKSKIGLISWSYAGESAILTQMESAEIDLVVGLSSIGFSGGIYSGSELAGKINREKLNVPYLILFERIRTNGQTRTIPDLFNSMHSNSRYVFFSELDHGNFNALEGMIPGILKTHKVQPWSKGGERAQLGYETVCQITLSFLDAVFHAENFDSFDEDMVKLKGELPGNFITITSPERD